MSDDEHDATDEELVDEDLIEEDLIFLLTHLLVVHGDAELVRAWVLESVDLAVEARAREQR